jgi:hypothetical protein
MADPPRRAINGAGLKSQATASIEVIVMTVSQHRRPALAGGRLRRAAGRSARVLQNLHNEQVYAWERFFRAGLPQPPGAQAPAAGPAGPERRAEVPRPGQGRPDEAGAQAAATRADPQVSGGAAA